MLLIIGILSVLLLSSVIVILMMIREHRKGALSRMKINARYENYKEKYELIRKRVEDFFQEEGTGKIGVIEFTSNFTSLPRGFVEVEEIKKAGDKVKIKILDISPKPGTTDEQLIKELQSDWIENDRVTWVDGWQQKVRGKTIEDILDEDTEIETEPKNKKDKDKDKDDNTEN